MATTRQITQVRVQALIVEDQDELTTDEFCRACSAQMEQLVALVDEGVLAPRGAAPGEWRFSGVHVRRARVAVRLQRDLGVNTAGAALALELMDEVERLRAALRARG